MKTKDELMAQYRDNDADDEYFLEAFVDIRDLLVQIVEELRKQRSEVVRPEESVGTTA